MKHKPNSRMMETHVDAQTMEAFFEVWLISLERHLPNLLHAIELNNEENDKDLIDQIVAHYGEYFSAKEKVAQENVFRVISPTWFTSFERAHFWIGGYMPCLAFRLIRNNVIDLTDDQSQRINRLMEEIKAEEKQVTDEFSRVQEWMSSPPVIEMVMHVGSLMDGEENKMDSAVDELKMAMESLVDCADYLRKKAVGILVLEILKPAQAVRFLAGAITLQLRLHRWGMQRDLQNQSSF